MCNSVSWAIPTYVKNGSDEGNGHCWIIIILAIIIIEHSWPNGINNQAFPGVITAYLPENLLSFPLLFAMLT